MPDDIKVNDLPITPIVDDADTVMIVQSNATTKQTSLGDIGNHIIQDKTYSELNTQNKHIIDAINEVKGVELIGTIKAYEGTVILYSDHIKANSKIRVFFETYGMSAKDIRATPGQVVVKINPLEEDVKVLVQVI